MTQKTLYVSKVGEYAEGFGFKVVENYHAERADQFCPHASAESRVVPRVVIAHNEGGFNCTIVCLDCVLEAVEQSKREAANDH